MAPKRRIDDAVPFVADENHVSGRQRLAVATPSAPHREFTTGFAGELTAAFDACMKKLNRSYHDHVKSLDMNQVCSQEPFVDVVGAAEYARVESDLRNRYEVADYELVVFGSNELTQLGLAEITDDASEEDGEEKFNDYAPLLNTRIPKARQVSAGGTHAVVLQDGTPYAWGSNDEGATAWRSGGDGSSSDPRPITGFLSRDGENDNGRILQVACGNCHTIFLAAGRRVYVVGSYKDADSTDFMVPEEVGGKILTRHYSPVQVQLPEGFGNPIRVFSSCSANYSVIEVEHSAEESTLLTFGFGNSGELARGIPLPRTAYFDAKRASELKKHESKDLAFDVAFVLKNHMTPRPAIFASGSQRKKVLSVACGAAHLLVAAREPGQSESNVFSTGHNNYGQVGHGYGATPDEEKKDPKKKANFLELTMVRSKPEFVVVPPCIHLTPARLLLDRKPQRREYRSGCSWRVSFALFESFGHALVWMWPKRLWTAGHWVQSKGGVRCNASNDSLSSF